MKEERTSAYFSKNALQWSKHYQGGSFHLRLFNSVFRRGLKQRWDATIKHSAPINGKAFLDIGCGNGVYSVFLAKEGAKRVKGIDFAEGMIELSRKNAEDHL